jgi:hypothetical protein
MMSRKPDEQKYTDPELRERIKEEIKESEKGGKSGQWSARKSQRLTQEYERRGGGYRGEKDESQRSLERWTEEEWQTRDGDARAREGDETKRYLPKRAWENMSEEEKRETEQKKREGSKSGEQYVENTERARKARREAKNLPIDGYDALNADEFGKRLEDLSEGQLETVRDYERTNENRKTVMQALDRKL